MCCAKCQERSQQVLALRLTKAHKVEDDRPPFRRALEYVIIEALQVDEYDEDEPEPEGPLRVDIAWPGELELGCDAT